MVSSSSSSWCGHETSSVKMCDPLHHPGQRGFSEEFPEKFSKLWAKYFISKWMKYNISVKVMASTFLFYAYCHSSYLWGIFYKLNKLGIKLTRLLLKFIVTPDYSCWGRLLGRSGQILLLAKTGTFSVSYYSKLLSKMATAIPTPSQVSFCRMTTSSFPLWVYFTSLWIWAGPWTCFDQQNVVKMMLCDCQRQIFRDHVASAFILSLQVAIPRVPCWREAAWKRTEVL